MKGAAVQKSFVYDSDGGSCSAEIVVYDSDCVYVRILGVAWGLMKRDGRGDAIWLRMALACFFFWFAEW